MASKQINVPSSAAEFLWKFGHVPPVPYESIKGITKHSSLVGATDLDRKKQAIAAEKAATAQKERGERKRLMRKAAKKRAVFLFIVGKKGKVSAAEIANETGIDSGSVYVALSSLDGQGVIARSLVQTKWQKNTFAIATEKGLELAEEIIRDSANWS